MHLANTTAQDGRALDDRLRQFSAAPPQTRMLVCADGSTTLLLEALMDARLRVQVAEQRRVSARHVPEVVCLHLGVEPSESVVHRLSRIVTPSNDVVSINRVVIGGPASADLVPPEAELLGPHLQRIGVVARREPLGAARDTWPLGRDGRDCVSKEYVIDCGVTGWAYVHERFNPDFVPLETGSR